MLPTLNPPFYIEIQYIDENNNGYIQLANTVCKRRSTAMKRAEQWCKDNNITCTYIDATLSKIEINHLIEDYMGLTL